MKLLGKDIRADELLSRIGEKLAARGLAPAEDGEELESHIEFRVDPLTFNLHALEEHSDPTRALPLHTHRGGLGQVVLVAKWAFRKTCQVFINEALARQRVFNGHTRDAYAQLSAEMIRLREQVERLERERESRLDAKAAPPKRGKRRPRS